MDVAEEEPYPSKRSEAGHDAKNKYPAKEAKPSPRLLGAARRPPQRRRMCDIIEPTTKRVLGSERGVQKMERVRMRLKTKRKPAVRRSLKNNDLVERRQAVIDILRPINGLKALEGRINRVQVFENGDSHVDYVVCFETDRGTLTWFANRGMLRELGSM